MSAYRYVDGGPYGGGAPPSPAGSAKSPGRSPRRGSRRGYIEYDRSPTRRRGDDRRGEERRDGQFDKLDQAPEDRTSTKMLNQMRQHDLAFDRYDTVVRGSFHIEGVNYSKYEACRSRQQQSGDFADAIRDDIISEVGNGVRRDDIKLRIYPGAIKTVVLHYDEDEEETASARNERDPRLVDAEWTMKVDYAIRARDLMRQQNVAMAIYSAFTSSFGFSDDKTRFAYQTFVDKASDAKKIKFVRAQPTEGQQPQVMPPQPQQARAPLPAPQRHPQPQHMQVVPQTQQQAPQHMQMPLEMQMTQPQPQPQPQQIPQSYVETQPMLPSYAEPQSMQASYAEPQSMQASYVEPQHLPPQPVSQLTQPRTHTSPLPPSRAVPAPPRSEAMLPPAMPPMSLAASYPPSTHSVNAFQTAAPQPTSSYTTPLPPNSPNPAPAPQPPASFAPPDTYRDVTGVFDAPHPTHYSAARTAPPPSVGPHSVAPSHAPWTPPAPALPSKPLLDTVSRGALPEIAPQSLPAVQPHNAARDAELARLTDEIYRERMMLRTQPPPSQPVPSIHAPPPMSTTSLVASLPPKTGVFAETINVAARAPAPSNHHHPLPSYPPSAHTDSGNVFGPASTAATTRVPAASAQPGGYSVGEQVHSYAGAATLNTAAFAERGVPVSQYAADKSVVRSVNPTGYSITEKPMQSLGVLSGAEKGGPPGSLAGYQGVADQSAQSFNPMSIASPQVLPAPQVSKAAPPSMYLSQMSAASERSEGRSYYGGSIASPIASPTAKAVDRSFMKMDESFMTRGDDAMYSHVSLRTRGAEVEKYDTHITHTKTKEF